MLYRFSLDEGKVGLHNAWRMMDIGKSGKETKFETLCRLRSQYNDIKKDVEKRYLSSHLNEFNC